MGPNKSPSTAPFFQCSLYTEGVNYNSVQEGPERMGPSVLGRERVFFSFTLNLLLRVDWIIRCWREGGGSSYNWSLYPIPLLRRVDPMKGPFLARQKGRWEDERPETLKEIQSFCLKTQRKECEAFSFGRKTYVTTENFY